MAESLADNQRLRAALTGPHTNPNIALAAPQALTPLPIRALAIAPATVGDAIGSIVVVFVGDALFLKICWPDGAGMVGEVIRSNKVRDVAIIKTDAKGRKALRLRQQPVAIGENI